MSKRWRRRKKDARQASTQNVQRLTRQALTHLLLWERLAIVGLLAVSCSGIWLAHRLQQGAVPIFVRALFSLSGTFCLYAMGRMLRSSDTRFLHGSAHWADGEGAGLRKTPVSPALSSEAFFLGMERGSPVELPGIFARQHGIILGGTGTGKTRGFFLPNAAFSRGDSLLCTDPKGELWRYTSGFHARATRYAPTEPDESACFNWIPLCREARYAELCARTLIESGEEGEHRAEAVWIEAETAFLAALFAHTATLAQPTPLTAYWLFTRQKQSSLLEQLHASSSDVAREQAMIFDQTQERMRGSIVPAVAAKLQFLRDPNVARFTSASLEAPDFGRLRRRPEAMYWCLSEHDMGRLRPLTSLFFTLAMEQIARAVSPDCPDAIPVRGFFDEIGNVGTLPRFDSTVTLSRSRGLSLWLGLQSLSQLEDRYGKASAQTILANCATKVVLPGLDIDSAKYISQMLGQTTIMTERRAWNLKHLLGRTSSVSFRRSETERSLLTPDEVRRLGTREVIIVTSNRAPVLLQRFFYDYPPQTTAVSPLGPAQASLLASSREPVVEAVTDDTKQPPPFPHDLLSQACGKESLSKKSERSTPFQIRRIPRTARRISMSKGNDSTG